MHALQCFAARKRDDFDVCSNRGEQCCATGKQQQIKGPHVVGFRAPETSAEADPEKQKGPSWRLGAGGGGRRGAWLLMDRGLFLEMFCNQIVVMVAQQCECVHNSH